jgi:DNA ligase-1
MLLAQLVATTDAVAATSSRTEKRDRLAELLGALAPDEIEPAVGYVTGAPRQGRIGVGWATLASLPAAAADRPTLEVGEVDRILGAIAATSGSGSERTRASLLGDLFGRATAAEADFLRRLLGGELRQGAQAGVVADAVARAAHVPLAAVQRAAMFSGDLGTAAVAALTGGRPALDRIGLQVLHPVQPMLAATAPDVGAALSPDGTRPRAGAVSVEWKLDGARVQVHRRGDEVRIFTRNLNDVTERLPGVASLVRALPARDVVLDGEVLRLAHDDRPLAFQDTMSTFGREAGDGPGPDTGSGFGPGTLRPFFFDVLHVDGRDLIDEPLTDRLAALDEVARPHRIPGLITADPSAADAFLAGALAAGHEGVMVKDLDSPYQAGRRGRSWRKVKPVHLFDLVVLAVEWGSGRRRGWLSNLHLGARDPASGGFVMVGKTFKGMTDELLAWQTEQLLAREVSSDRHVVHVRPELVVEIALDGVQASTRYPGGLALRFARVRRYREDKTPAEADTIDALRSLLVRS